MSGSAAEMESLGSRFELGPIDQISFAVASIATSLPFYEALFGRPFDVREVALPAERTTYRGRPAAARLKLAFGSTAGLQVELVEPLEGDTPAADQLRSHGEGVHHVRFRVADVEDTTGVMRASGFEEMWRGSNRAGKRFAYLEAPSALGYTAVELLEF